MEGKRLAAHLKDRPSRLEAARKSGIKVVGYLPGNLVPEEIIYASGAIPLGLIGGGARPAEAALAVVPNVICPFARAQIGNRLLKDNFYYGMMDMLVAPITCQHLKKVAEIWEYQGGLEIFKLGIPHHYAEDFEAAYYTEGLKKLKERLQKLTGNEITDERLSSAVSLYNRMRELLRKISLLRRASPPPLSASYFARLNHASFYADPPFMVDVLQSAYEELSVKQSAAGSSAPRVLLIGPNVSEGDYAVLEMVREAGGHIVAEEICEGIRYYWNDIESSGDSYRSLTQGYLTDKVPCAFLRNSAAKRLEHALWLVKEFNVSGIIWYELLCCETYDSEAYYFTQKMREHGIPVLILESDYGSLASGQLKTRIQAFIEILEGVAG